MAIYDDIFGEGEEYLRCEIMAINEGFTVKVVDYGITRKVDRVFLLDVDKHKGVDWVRMRRLLTCTSTPV